MHDVLVSYAHADNDAVSQLVEALSKCGLSVWIARTVIADIASISRSIAPVLADSKVFLAIIPGTMRFKLPVTALSSLPRGDVRYPWN